MDERFEMAMINFVTGYQRIHTEYMRKQFPKLTPNTISTTSGKRYLRVVRSDSLTAGRSVHCFVDLTNGDVLKAASWKAPAKHARGNIFDEHNGLGSMGEYGPAYLR